MNDVTERAGAERRGGRRRRLVGASVAVAAGLAALVTPALPASPAAGQAAQPPFDYADTSGVDVQGTPQMVDLDGSGSAYQPDPRLWDVEVTSPSIFVAGTNPAPPPAVDPVQIPFETRIYLPDGYDHDRAAGYPVLYILHGGAGAYRDWSTPDGVSGNSCGNPLGSGGGDITDVLATAPTPVITVMVEAGCAGWYADWQGETDGNFSPKWETFHTQQLVGWVDVNLNTVADRSGRAIAGVSMGGLGSTRYAAHRPDLFSAVASFSGAVEMRHEPMQDTVSNSMWSYGATVDTQGLGMTEYRVTTGEPPEQEETSRLAILFGPSTPPTAPGETRPGWPAMNPTELAAAGEFADYDSKLAIYSGESVNWWDQGEEDIAIMNNALHDALDDTDVDHRYCRGFGTHDWSYWRNDLADFLQYAYDPTPPPTPAACPNNWGNPL